MTEAAPRHIVIVDDDPDLRRLTGAFLEDNGYRVSTAANGAELTRVLARGPVDLIVLDLMMPGEDGFAIIRRLRDRRPAIIMLSAMDEDHDRIMGLEVGADDYLGKPCNPRELLARIRAVLRRGEGDDGRGTQRRLGPWTIDLVARALAHDDGRTLQLTDNEFRILHALMERPQRIVSRDQLLDAAHGQVSEVFDRVVDVAISRLRKKMGADCPIRTVRSEGYMLTVRPARA